MLLKGRCNIPYELNGQKFEELLVFETWRYQAMLKNVKLNDVLLANQRQRFVISNLFALIHYTPRDYTHRNNITTSQFGSERNKFC